ncbi:MAG: hypothetical protein ACXWLM_12680, partial [Myxococcales bacterium]
ALQPADLPPAAPAPAWTPLRRAWFRFGFSLLLLHLLPFPLGIIPRTEMFASWYRAIWNEAVPWAAAHLLRLSGPVGSFGSGSGDRTWDHVYLFSLATVSLGAAAIWSALDRRPRYDLLRSALRVYVRYWLATVMLQYGLAKVFPMQFPQPSASALLGTFGDASPMHLLWIFMGFSPAYTAFAGAAECLGGALLFFRRTTLLGALILVGVLGNVVMLNLCYDVPVKLYSSLYLAVAVSLAWPDAARMARFFLLNRLVEPADLGTPRLSPRGRRIQLAAKAALIALLAGSTFGHVWTATHRPPDPLQGLYVVEQFKGGRPWKLVEITPLTLLVLREDGSQSRHSLGPYDAADSTLMIFDGNAGGAPGKSWTLSAKLLDGGLLLEGALGDEAVQARLRKTDRPPFKLTTRGFHFINEFPWNR